MDTSKEYILMCEKAKEIQDNGWDYWPEGTYVAQRGKINNDKVFHWLADGHGRRTQYDIWLPRQDQLQEMIGQPYSTRSKQLIELATFEDNMRPFNSYEKLWLAFVMKEKYNKIWKDEEWKTQKNHQ